MTETTRVRHRNQLIAAWIIDSFGEPEDDDDTRAVMPYVYDFLKFMNAHGFRFEKGQPQQCTASSREEPQTREGTSSRVKTPDSALAG